MKETAPPLLMLGVLLVSLLIAVFVPPIVSEVIRAQEVAYNRDNPPVKMAGILVGQTEDQAYIWITGAKVRDCQYLRIVAYSVATDGTRRDAFIHRISAPESGDTKQPGRTYDIGIWAITPIQGAERVQAETRHLCNDTHEVRSLVADVRLQGGR